MNNKIFNIIAFMFFFVMTSCEKDSSNDIIPNNPSNDSITSQPDTVDALHYWKVDNYTENDSITYFFENGSLLTISPDTLYGNTIQIGRMQESGEWSKEDEIFIFTDTLNLPCLVKTIDSYFTLEYFDNNTVSITAYDFDNKEINKKEFSIESIVNNNKTRASAIQTTNIALGIVDLVQFVKNPSSLTNNITALATALGWKTSLDGSPLLGSSIGTAGSLYGLIMNVGSKNAWVAAGISIAALIEELNKHFRMKWWGDNPLFMIDSISTSSTTAIIYYRLDYKGECNNPTADVSYRHNDSSTFFKSTSASKGQNNIKLSGLEPSKQYLARMSACGDGILGMFGQLHTSKYFTTQTPSAITGASDPQRESVNIKCQFKYLPEGAICGIRYNSEYGHNTVSCKSIESEQTITISDLIPITTYTYSTYIEYKGQYWNGQEKSFTTLPPNINGTWTVTEGDGESYTVTFQNGECSWSKEMASPGGYNISTDGKISFSICKQYVPEQWNMYDNANFDGVLDNKKSPSVITGNVLYIHGNWIGAYGEYKKTTFTATR